MKPIVENAKLQFFRFTLIFNIVKSAYLGSPEKLGDLDRFCLAIFL